MNQNTLNQSIRSSLLHDINTSHASQQNQQPVPQTQQQSILGSSVIQAISDNCHPSLKKKNIYDYVAEYTSKFQIIPPENSYLLAWHGVIMLIILYYLFEVGLLLGYGEPVWRDIMHYLIPVNIICIVCLIIDIGVNLFKAYYSKGLLIKNHRLIAKNYIPTYLIIDIVAIISVTLPFATNSYTLNWIKLLFLPKIRTLYLIDKEYIRITQLSIKIHTFYLLSRLVLLLILGSHYTGIFFYMIDYYVYATNYYGPNTPTLCWIYNAQAFSEMVLILPWYGQYLYTMYYSIGTMTTIAYGDITPLNPLQTIYTIFALLIYTVCFAYILSQVLRILMQAQASKFEHTNTLLIITNMMRDKMISEKVQVKVRSFYEKMWKEEVYRNRVIEQELIDSLPQKIRNQLFEQLYFQMFEAMGFRLQENKAIIETDFMVNIANSIREERLVEGYSLYRQKQAFNFQEENSHCVYFIKQSQKSLKEEFNIEIAINNMHPQQKIKICGLTHGTVGYLQFLTGQNRTHQAILLKSIITYKISRKEFLQSLVLANQLQRQNICLITENIRTRYCCVCGEENSHEFRRCPFVTYQPNKYQIILKSKSMRMLKSESSDRSSFSSSNRKPSAFKRDRPENKKWQGFKALENYVDLRDNPYKIRNIYEMMVSKPYYSKMIHSPLKKSKSMNISMRVTQNRGSITMDEAPKKQQIQQSIIFDKKNEKKGISSLMEGLTIKQVESEEEDILDSEGSAEEKQRIPKKGEEYGSNIFDEELPHRPQKKTEEYGSNIFDEPVPFQRNRPAPLQSIQPFLDKIQFQSEQQSEQIQNSKKQPLIKRQSSSDHSQSVYSEQSSESSESSQDLDNYMKETQNFIKHLEQEEHNTNVKNSIKNKIETSLKMSKSAFLMDINNFNRLKLNDDNSGGRIRQMSMIRDSDADLRATIRKQAKNAVQESIKGFFHTETNLKQSISAESPLKYSTLELKSSVRDSRMIKQEKKQSILGQSIEEEYDAQKEENQLLAMQNIRKIVDEQFEHIKLDKEIEQIRQIEEIYMKNAMFLQNNECTDTIKEYSMYHPSFNLSTVLEEYNRSIGFNKKRRHIEAIVPLNIQS